MISCRPSNNEQQIFKQRKARKIFPFWSVQSAVEKTKRGGGSLKYMRKGKTIVTISNCCFTRYLIENNFLVKKYSGRNGGGWWIRTNCSDCQVLIHLKHTHICVKRYSVIVCCKSRIRWSSLNNILNIIFRNKPTTRFLYYLYHKLKWKIRWRW